MYQVHKLLRAMRVGRGTQLQLRNESRAGQTHSHGMCLVEQEFLASVGGGAELPLSGWSY